MRRLRDLPIRRKLMLVILLTSSFALVLMGSALITYELLTFRRTLASNITVLAKIIGANSTAALAFDDRRDAQETLSALAAEQQVRAAAIYDRAGRIFAYFPSNLSESDFPPRALADGPTFEGEKLLMFQPITLEEDRLGTIYLHADLGALYHRINFYGAMLALVGVCAFVATFALSSSLQRRISQPILELARVATAVSERQDYSVRGVKHGEDEIGQLTEAFNQMLTRIGESSAAVSASEERLRLALEGSQTGTWDWNIETARISWDDYMYPLYGRSQEEFDGTYESFIRFVHPEDRERLQEEIGQTIKHGGDIDLSFRAIDAAGQVRHMSARGRVIKDANGRPVRMSGVNMDVSKAKHAEQELSKAKEAAEAANKAKDDFLAVLSHELRTPLTPVLATVSMLEEEGLDLPPQVTHDLQMIRRNIEVEARLIDDLLDVTAVRRGKLQLNRHVIDVRHLLEHALQNYCAVSAARKHLRVALDAQAKETFVLADSSRITQVFWNLLQNACKFTPQHGSISIRLTNEKLSDRNGRDDATVLIVEIADTGIGIEPELIPRIFNAFEQGEPSRSRMFGGLGLGLAISQAIVELHGGTLTAESEGRDKGAKFTLRLETVPAPGTEVPRDFVSTEGAAGKRRLRILLVEDHVDTAEQLTRLLTRAGHVVTTAGTLSEGKAAFNDDFDLLISDLGLPDGSGHELMRDLSKERVIPAIALSGYGMREDVAASHAAGFARHLTKPVNWEELRSTIAKLAAEVPEPAA